MSRVSRMVVSKKSKSFGNLEDDTGEIFGGLAFGKDEGEARKTERKSIVSGRKTGTAAPSAPGQRFTDGKYDAYFLQKNPFIFRD